MCVDSKGDANKPVDLWQCHQQGGNQVKTKSHTHGILKHTYRLDRLTICVRNSHIHKLKHFHITSAVGAGNPKNKKKASSVKVKNKNPSRNLCAVHFIIIIYAYIYYFPQVFWIKLARHFLHSL